ncbi:hypothetical protein D3C81_929080 [compost metagenome]
MIGVVGQFAAQAQVTQHDIDIDVGAHGDHVRVHQTAGGVLRVRQHLLKPLAVLAVHRLEHFVDDGVRQILDQIGKVIDVQVFDRGDDFVRVHVRQQAFAHVVADMHQHLAVVLGIHQAPHHFALAGRQRLQQVADFCRRERIDQAADRAKPATVERVGKQTQLSCRLVVAYRFGHAQLPGVKRPLSGTRMQHRRCSARHYHVQQAVLHWLCDEKISRGRCRRSSARCRDGRARPIVVAPAHAMRPGRRRGWRGVLPAMSPDAG